MQDHWCGNSSLCLAFPDLFGIAQDKDVIVAWVWDCSRVGGFWNIQFLRAFSNWEVDSEVCLFNSTQNFVVSIEGMRLDGREWRRRNF